MSPVPLGKTLKSPFSNLQDSDLPGSPVTSDEYRSCPKKLRLPARVGALRGTYHAIW
jgi:hypothetical protein